MNLTYSKQRILFVSPFSSLYGGELCFLEIATGLDSDRYEVVTAVGGDGPLIDRLTAAGIEVKSYDFPYMSYRGLPALRFAMRVLPVVFSLAVYIRRNHVALVYNNSLFNPYGALAAWLAGVPCIWHIHDLGHNRIIKAVMTRLIGAVARKIVVVSQAVKAIFPPAVQSQIRLVYNGVDTNQFHPALYDGQEIRTELGIGASQPVVLYIGRLHEAKRPQDAIEAVRLLIDRMPDLVLLMAGRGELEPALQSMIERYGLQENVRMLGYRQDVARLLAAADVLVLPSDHEAFGRIIIEAMSMKTPVVSTRVGGVPEVVNPECGILVPPANPLQLAAALERILTDPELAQRMGEAARQRVEEHFTMTQYVSRLEKVIHESLSGDRSVSVQLHEVPR
jgi:glycosyltransferase involved in cell wall biosynthesis